MSKHTPGPWFAQDTRLVGGQVAVVGPNHDRKAGEQGVMVVAHVNGRSGEQGANARLIAAAPDLLAALQLVLVADSISPGDCYNPDGSPNKLWGSIDEAKAAARAAIAKATGGDL